MAYRRDILQGTTTNVYLWEDARKMGSKGRASGNIGNSREQSAPASRVGHRPKEAQAPVFFYLQIMLQSLFT